jgi:hypothetical protein
MILNPIPFIHRILKEIQTLFGTSIMSSGGPGQPILASYKEVIGGYLGRGDEMVSGDEGKMIKGFVEKAPAGDSNFSYVLQNSYFLVAG